MVVRIILLNIEGNDLISLMHEKYHQTNKNAELFMLNLLESTQLLLWIFMITFVCSMMTTTTNMYILYSQS